MPKEAIQTGEGEHKPVLLHEAIEGLSIQKTDIVFDGTVGHGGHSRAICESLGSGGMLIATDKDNFALKKAESALEECKAKTVFVNEDFQNVGKVLKQIKIDGIDKAILDLGMNISQFTDSGRGFSFQKNEPLIMTLSDNVDENTLTAEQVVNEWDEESLEAIFKGYGEERFSKKIAKGIVLARESKRIKTTGDLVEVILKSVPGWYTHKKIHFATKTFQAVRIAVNDEVRTLENALEAILKLLNKNGRLAVISFHSGEDRIVKNIFKQKAKTENYILINKKPIKPTKEEISINPKSRSGKLRIIEKTKDNKSQS